MPLVPRDLVTRHERTLHAKLHNNEKIADEVTVACSLSTQATNHETPVSDDTSDGEEIDLERQSYPETLEYQSPRIDVASLASSPITGRFEANFQTASPFGVEDRDVILEGILQAELETRLPGQRCDETSEECSNGSKRAQPQSCSPHTADPRPHQREVLELDMIDPALFSDIGQEMDMDFGLPEPSANVPSHEPTEVLRQHAPKGTDHHTDRSVAMLNDPDSFVFSPNTIAELNFAAIDFASLTQQADDISENRHQEEDGGLATSGSLGDYALNSRKGAQAVIGPSSVPLVSPTEVRETERASDLPSLSEDGHHPCPMFTISDETWGCIQQDLFRRLPNSDKNTPIPAAKFLQSCLSSYITCFHIHFPLIHIQTLELQHAPSPLILAICAIGALYRLDRRRARMMYNLAKQSSGDVS